MKKLTIEPKPYAIGVAMAFALLAPAGISTEATPVALVGATPACASDSCMTWPGWICRHGSHSDEGYCDPTECAL